VCRYSVPPCRSAASKPAARRPAEDYAIEMLSHLKAVLGPIGWEPFRAYLRKVKAPFMVTITPEVDDETFVRPGSRSPVY
jgi:hypothetical protein